MNQSFDERQRRGGSARWDPTRQRWTDEQYGGPGGSREEEASWSAERGGRSQRDQWQDERRRERLSPYQLSEGGPAWEQHEERDFRRDYGHGRYPEHPERHQPDERRGSDLRYGLNGLYEEEEDGETGQTWRRREPLESRSADTEWVREVERSRGRSESDWSEDRRRPYHPAQFKDLRTDVRSTEPYLGEYRPEWEERRWRDERRDSDWQGRRDERGEPEHGYLYRLGHRLGEAVGEIFGTEHEKHTGQEQQRERQREPQRTDLQRRTGPKGYRRSDDSIRDQLCTRLAYATGLDVSNVSVEVASGVVSLSGTVRRRSEKFDIEDIADNTFGVTDVQNHIRVQRDEPGSAGASTPADTGATGTARVSETTAQDSRAGTPKTWSPD